MDDRRAQLPLGVAGCALIFPALLGTAARIESTCHTTGVPVRVCVGAGSVSDVRPDTAVVSLVHPEDMSSVRSAFCNQVHFFAFSVGCTPLARRPYGRFRPSVADAYRLGRTMADSLRDQTLLPQPAAPGKSVQTTSDIPCSRLVKLTSEWHRGRRRDGKGNAKASARG